MKIYINSLIIKRFKNLKTSLKTRLGSWGTVTKEFVSEPMKMPVKTWEGFWGGMLCVAAMAVLLWYNLPPSHLHLGLGSLLALALATAGASVVGDLTVSLLKREVGLKDSGSLLPGHGGILDRLDSICGAAPVFTLGLLLVGY